jgi:7,8-dihydro-6-hydroxymethylpterin-pyrophosphokinase
MYPVSCIVILSYIMPTIAYIGLGSNRGDKKANCRRALELLEAAGRVRKVSSFY